MWQQADRSRIVAARRANAEINELRNEEVGRRAAFGQREQNQPSIDTGARISHGPASVQNSREQIISGLKELLRQQKQLKTDVNALTEDTRLNEVGFDSISILDFMYDVESRFNVRTEIEDLVRMERVKDLIDHLVKEMAR